MAHTIHETNDHSQQRLLRRPDVLHRCGISNSTLHRLMNAGDFPSPIQLSPRAVAWVESDIDTWIEKRIEASRASKASS